MGLVSVVDTETAANNAASGLEGLTGYEFLVRRVTLGKVLPERREEVLQLVLAHNGI